MSRFAPNRAYQQHLDIRFAGPQPPTWAQPLIEGRPPNARCWLVVLPRRAGKSWLASAIVKARPAGTTRRVDLRDDVAEIRRAGLQCLVGGKAAPRVDADVLLVDEPGLSAGQPGVSPEALAGGLAKVLRAGVTPIVLATPREHALLIGQLGADGPKDVLLPPPLNDEEIARMAAREPDWAPEVIQRIRQAETSWLHTPFLLELVLHVAESDPLLRTDIGTLLRTARDQAEAHHAYLDQVFHNGLTDGQRSELRISRWQTAGVGVVPVATPTLLVRTAVPGDPVVADHLPDVLRIHHISDLHHGGTLRQNVDAKDRTRAGDRLAHLAGAGSPLDSYLNHVRQLAAEGRAPHLVIVTGDIVNRPDDRFGAQAHTWLKQLGEVLADHRDLRTDDPRVVLVGGNHDVSWELCLDADPHARHRWFAEVFADYPHPDLHLPDAGARRLFLKYPNAGLRIALLGSAESGGEAARDDDHGKFEAAKRRYAATDDQDAVRELVHTFERLDPGVISRTVLDRLRPEPGYLTLAALHHPLSPVPTVEIAPYSGIVNAGQAKRSLAIARTALVLHGHTHLGFLAAERLLGSGPAWTVRIAGAATLASASSDEQNGYNQVFVAREGGAHIVLVRPVRFEGGHWTPQQEVAFRPGASDEHPATGLLGDPAHAG